MSLKGLSRRAGLFGVVLILAAGRLLAAEPWTEATKLLANDGAAGEHYGERVAVDGDTIVVGALLADGAQTSSGAAYVYSRQSGGAVVFDAKLFARDGESFDWFGAALAVERDTIAVGAVFAEGAVDESGVVYVFKRQVDGSWAEEARLANPGGDWDERFGAALTLEGDTLIVGAPQYSGDDYQSGGVFVYERDTLGVWSLSQTLTASDGEAWDAFGFDVALDGGALVVGAPQDNDIGYGSGSIYLFALDAGGLWVEIDKLNAWDAGEGDGFGAAVDVGSRFAIVGAASDDDRGLNAGAAYLFRVSATGLTADSKLLASDGQANDQFGVSVALHDNRALVGAYWDGVNGSNSGSAYVFHADSSGVWSEEDKLVPSDGAVGDWFGQSVGLDAGVAVVGSPNDDDLGDRSGSAYVFESRGFGPRLRVEGDCPGPVRVVLSDATPKGRVLFVAGFNPGSTVIPVGPCAGIAFELDRPFAPGAPRLLRADDAGEITLEFSAPSSVCGMFVQALDVATCRVSDLVTIR
ncbi:MAG: hypothetical protein ACF8PN_10400 [Phycisphaerales bacterium]